MMPGITLFFDDRRAVTKHSGLEMIARSASGGCLRPTRFDS